ncbi:cystatin-B-like [Lithobates pipiens]
MSASVVVGAPSEPRDPTEEDQAILDAVKPQYEQQSGTNPGRFKAILVSTQPVAGTIYIFKVDIGEDKYIHVCVLVPLPFTGEGPTLLSFQTGKTKDDELRCGDEGQSQ